MAEPGGAVERLDQVTRRLRRECPWDREQDERSIVPHTVEEAYELADAAHARDDAKLVDELGDVLFQVLFLALLLEERGQGDLAVVADGCREKLIRRHPHVFGEVRADSASEVLRNWDAIKSDTEGGGLFGDLPETLPATLLAKKVRRRAAHAVGSGADQPELGAAAERLAGSGDVEERFEHAGELLFAAVGAATDAGADPELALRAAVERYVQRVEGQTR
jgi:MazG family protein